MSLLHKIKFSLAQPFDVLFAERPNPILYTGPKKMLEIPEICVSMGVSRVFLVTSKGIHRRGQLDLVISTLESKGITTTVFDDITPDPTYEVVEHGLEALREYQGDCVLAVGGGSVIDATKAIVASYGSGKRPEKLKGLLKVSKRDTPFIVVPTTAGTGSETTIVAVVSDTKTHKKGLIISPKIIPDVVILDPEITVTLPPSLTASTAADALTHALEAYVSRYSSGQSKFYSEISIRLIFDNLEKALSNPTDLKVRENLLVGSLYGGMAFTRAYVGYVHAFSHAIGGKYGVPHGVANAVILPHVMDFYKEKCQKQFAHLAHVIGLPTVGSEEEQAQAFLYRLQHLLQSVGIPNQLDDFPKSGIPEIVTMAFRECKSTYPVPKYFSKKEATQLLEKCAAK